VKVGALRVSTFEWGFNLSHRVIETTKWLTFL